MRNKLSVATSILSLCATASLWVGCSGYGGHRSDSGSSYYDTGSFYNDSYCQPVYQEPSNGYYQGGGCGDQKPSYNVVGSTVTCDGVTLTAKQPNHCLLGDQYFMDLEIQACRNVCDVVISTSLPEGVSFVRSDPEAFLDGQKLIWALDHMREGECRNVRIVLRCETEGCLCAAFCVQAVPMAMVAINCSKPILCCEKCGPEDACPGDMLAYTITVSNKGSCTARDVVVIDNIPDGLEHCSGMNTLTFKIGDLAPCESKRVNLCLKAVKRGRVCNTAIVSACNADQCSCEWCTTICKYCCEVTKEGPKEVRVGQNADYAVRVINVGDKPLTDVVVTDCAPNGTSIVSAEGATITGNRAIWRVDELRPGENVVLHLSLTTCTPGYYCNRVAVSSSQGCGCTAEAATRWRGTPALNVQIVDMEDPICVGETTSYRIAVFNQGSEPDENVHVTVRFPKQIVPISAVGASPGQVSGQTVTFAPYSPLSPRQTIEYRVDARAKEPGDARIKVEVMSDSITTPIVQEESTIVN